MIKREFIENELNRLLYDSAIIPNFYTYSPNYVNAVLVFALNIYGFPLISGTREAVIKFAINLAGDKKVYEESSFCYHMQTDPEFKKEIIKRVTKDHLDKALENNTDRLMDNFNVDDIPNFIIATIEGGGENE